MAKDCLFCLFCFTSVVNILGIGFYIWGEVAYNNELAKIFYIETNLVKVPNGENGIKYL